MFRLLYVCMFFIGIVSVATKELGTSPLDGRIVGGENASILDYPYHVGVEYLRGGEVFFRCGGAIIARTWILTAAHCVYGLFPTTRVRVGTSYKGVGGDLISVVNTVIHSEYSSSTYESDIALLQLETPITLSQQAQIVGLPNQNAEIIEGTLANVTGWGYTEEDGDVSIVLQVIEIPIISRSVCNDLITTNLVSDRMLCAGLIEGGKDACTGDGGGPLVSNSVLSGLVSWGSGCARPQSPGVYTNVAAFRDWITEQTGI